MEFPTDKKLTKIQFEPSATQNSILKIGNLDIFKKDSEGWYLNESLLTEFLSKQYYNGVSN
mgnify:CR=1 FL=1